MRAHSAAVAGVGQHQVVQPRLWDEIEGPQHGVCCIEMKVQALHQQRPLGAGQRRQAAPRQRTMPQFPAAALLFHAARLDIVLRAQGEQLLARGRRLNTRPCLAHHQGAALPMTLHELARGEPSEQGAGLVQSGAVVSLSGHGGVRRMRECATVP